MASYSVPGFHSNDSARCDKFLKEDSYIIVCTTDTEFLGTGMYFWGTESDARWWMREKDKEAVVKATLSLNNLLDLTDGEIVMRVQRTLDMVDALKWLKKDDVRRKYVKVLEKAPGVSIDALFQAFPGAYGRYDLIKGRQYEQHKKEMDFFFGTKLTTQALDIYCARSSNPISEREKVAV